MIIELSIVILMIFAAAIAVGSILAARHNLSRKEIIRRGRQTAVDIERLQKELDQMDQEQNREAL
jgi:hypothetical protein